MARHVASSPMFSAGKLVNTHVKHFGWRTSEEARRVISQVSKTGKTIHVWRYADTPPNAQDNTLVKLTMLKAKPLFKEAGVRLRDHAICMPFLGLSKLRRLYKGYVVDYVSTVLPDELGELVSEYV